MKKCLKLLIGLAISLGILLALEGCKNNHPSSLENALAIDTDGDPNGRVVLVEFVDYANPQALQMAPILTQLMQVRPKVRVIYKPICTDPTKSYITKLAVAAELQQRFLAAHHLLINQTAALNEEDTIALLSQALIDKDELKRQENTEAVSAVITNNNALARRWGVSVSPTFFIGKLNETPEKLTGPQTLATLLSIIDKEAG